MQNNLVENLRALCREKDISFAELERTIGLGNGTLSKWGESMPTVAKLSMVAQHFGVTMDELMYGNFDGKAV